MSPTSPSRTPTLTKFALRFLGTEFHCPADRDGDNVLTTDDFLATAHQLPGRRPQSRPERERHPRTRRLLGLVQAYNTGC